MKVSLGGNMHDPTDPVGRLLFNVLAMVAEFEADRLVEAGVVVVDTEQESEHMEQLGQVPLSREQYVVTVRQLRDQHVELPTECRPVDRLIRSSER